MQFRQRRNDALLQSLQAIANIHLAMQALAPRYATRIACASGADSEHARSLRDMAGLPGWVLHYAIGALSV